MFLDEERVSNNRHGKSSIHFWTLSQKLGTISEYHERLLQVTRTDLSNVRVNTHELSLIYLPTLQPPGGARRNIVDDHKIVNPPNK